jgi:K+ transporter
VVLHERNVILSVETLGVPTDEGERVQSIDFTQLSLRFDFMEDPDVPKALVSWLSPASRWIRCAPPSPAANR